MFKFWPPKVEKTTLKSCSEFLKSTFFSLLPKRPKQKNSCSKMWPVDQLATVYSTGLPSLFERSLWWIFTTCLLSKLIERMSEVTHIRSLAEYWLRLILNMGWRLNIAQRGGINPLWWNVLIFMILRFHDWRLNQVQKIIEK